MQITLKDLEQAINDLEKSTNKSVQIAVIYLNKERKRRKNSGRPSTSELSRKEQICEAVKRYRTKNKSG